MSCDPIYVPTNDCEDCSSLLARIRALEEAMAQKQDKLTAVGNISIENNVISFGLMCEEE